MNSNYSIRVNVDFVQLMMIVDALLTFVLDCHLYHDCDRVINVVVNRVDLLMHCPDSSYHVLLVFHLHLHLVQLVIKPVVIHAYFPMVDMIHRMRSLVVAIAVNVDVLG